LSEYSTFLPTTLYREVVLCPYLPLLYSLLFLQSSSRLPHVLYSRFALCPDTDGGLEIDYIIRGLLDKPRGSSSALEIATLCSALVPLVTLLDTPWIWRGYTGLLPLFENNLLETEHLRILRYRKQPSISTGKSKGKRRSIQCHNHNPYPPPSS
jgi:hypothetical protein